jgi:pimeloyl-ACP methyl ester carboxylesterase
MYYEIYGQGKPLVLIHGNGGNIQSMGHQIQYFSEYYHVIVADSIGHGKSDIGKGKLTYEQMANDWASLLDQVGIDSTYVIGWSDGGIIGLLLAIHHAPKVRMLAAMGANLQPDTSAVYSWAVNWVKQMDQRADKMISKNDTTQNWKLLKQYLSLVEKQPNISLTDLHKISVPVLVLAGDKDVIREEHTVLIFQNIPKAHLCIFPGETHLIPVANPELFNQTVERFFKNPFKRPDTKDFFK